ncbi:MAG: O-antigen ligase domain-containing protein, partial [Chitinophagaceae bacterium]
PAMFLLHAAWVQRHFSFLLKVFCCSVAVACVATVLLYWLPEDVTRNLVKSFPMLREYPETFSREAFGLYSPFIDRIQFSSLIGLAILSCLYMLQGPKKWLPALLLPLLGYTMMVLGGRGGQLALLVSLLVPGIYWVYKLLSRKVFPNLSKTAVGGISTFFVVLVLAFLPFAAYHTNSAVHTRVNQSLWEISEIRSGHYDPDNFLHFTTVRRLVSWQNLWRIIEEQPILGTGTGDFGDAITRAYESDEYPLIENIHNQYLMFWAMLGIVGLAVFVGVMAYWAVRMKNQGAVTIFAWSVLLFYAVNMIPDAVLYQQIDNMAFCAFLSMIGLCRGESHSPKSERKKPA